MHFGTRIDCIQHRENLYVLTPQYLPFCLLSHTGGHSLDLMIERRSSQSEQDRVSLSVDMEVVDVLPMKFDSYYVSLLSEKYKSGNKGFSFGNLVRGFFSGLSSNMKAKKGEYSSQTYVIKHKK